MVKRVVKRQELQFLKNELQYLEESEVLPTGKSKEIQDLYEVEKRISFTKTLLYVGTILIGAGILSFFASNWDEISKLFKFIIIIGLFVTSNLIGFRLERSYPKTSKSLYYLGVIVFGAGIFLVGQMFHFGGNFQLAFLWWSLGILPLAWVLRDKWILMAAAIFVLIYLTDGTYMYGEGIPFWILLWIVAIYVLNDIIGYTKVTGFIVGLLMLEFIWTILNYLLAGVQDSGYIYGLVYMAIGISLIFFKGKIREVDIFLGHLVHCGAAITLSFSEAWPIDWMYIPVSIIYLLFVLYLIKKGSLLNIIILCVMIFRFYIDISFDFLPKSFVFIIGGVILLGFGFYFEKQRKKGGGLYE